MYKPNKKRFFTALLVLLLIAASIYAGYQQLPASKTSPGLSNSQTGTINALIASQNIRNKNILSAYKNTSSSRFIPGELQSKEEGELSRDDYFKISLRDDIPFTTQSNRAFPYQRYKIRIDQDLSTVQKLNVEWEGHSNRMVDLYAWDYIQQQWTYLSKNIGRNGNDLSLTSELNIQNMVKDATAEIMVAAAQKNDVIKGKIPDAKEYDFTFAWLSDTQYYSASYPDIYDKMTQYIVDKQKEKKIVYAMHTGDLVDNSDEMYQWKNADHSMKILDKAGIPYGVLAGNHDVGHTAVNYTNYYEFFGEKRFKNKPTYGGSPNNNRDHYDLVTAGGNDYIILYLGWSIPQDTINWANETLKKYSNRKAIVALHGYMSMRGNYVEQGREIYEKIADTNSNVFLVLCGHYGGAVVNVKRSGDRVFYEMLSDYQFNPEGGAGYFRLLHFDTKNGLVYVNTYSPHKEDYNFYEDSKEEFILPLTEEKGDIILSTDYIDIKA